jgi:hypothetical protein
MKQVLSLCLLLAVAGLAHAGGVEIQGPVATGTRVRIGEVEGIILRVTDDGVYVKVNEHEVEDAGDIETQRLVELYKDKKWDRDFVLLFMRTYEIWGDHSCLPFGRTSWGSCPTMRTRLTTPRGCPLTRCLESR